MLLFFAKILPVSSSQIHAIKINFNITVGRPSRVQYNDVCFVVGHCPGRSFSVSPAVESCLRILLTERLIGPRPSVTDGPAKRLKNHFPILYNHVMKYF